MDTKLLRMLWSVVESTPTHVLRGFDDSTLSRHLLYEVENQIVLSREEQRAVYTYISARTPLIRDLAYA